MNFANTSALTYVDLDEDTDSMEATLDTPPPNKVGGKPHLMPHVEPAKPVETPEDVAAKEEEKQGNG